MFQKGVIMNNKFETDCCDMFEVHDNVVCEVRKSLPDDECLESLSDIFKVFGDKTRIRILYVLHVKELCVCDIAQLLNMNQSAISHQLKVLRQAKLIKSRREGKSVYYSLDDSHVHEILNMGMEHIME